MTRCASATSTPGGAGSLPMTLPASWRRRFAAGAVFAFRRGHEDREQAAGKPALSRLGQIEMALVLALQERRDRVGAAVPMQPQQHVVVAVEDRNGLGRGHLGSF